MLFLEEHLYTLLHTKIIRGHLSVGRGGCLTGYKCGTCLGTGKPFFRYREVQLVDHVWFDGLDGYPLRNTVSG